MSALPTDLFGMPLVMADPDVSHAQCVLTHAWLLQVGRALHDFEADIEELAGWFHPKLRGLTVRDRLASLPALDPGARRLSATVLMPCGDDRYLVTPEGRAWLECVGDARDVGDGHLVFTAAQAEPYERKLLGLYRGWSRHRIEDVVEKRTGAGPPLLPPAAGIVLLLLVNRSLSPDTAIRRVRRADEQEKVDDVVADVLEPFADRLAGKGGRARRREHYSLWSGYPLTEARRRLAGRLVLDRAEGFVYIDPESESDVVEFVARDIARRRGADETTVGAAFDALVRAYRRRLDDLSGLGSGFERIGRTDALRERLLQAVHDRL